MPLYFLRSNWIFITGHDIYHGPFYISRAVVDRHAISTNKLILNFYYVGLYAAFTYDMRNNNQFASALGLGQPKFTKTKMLKKGMEYRK